jgi:glycerophosphoryl diester phosphodiesterase
MTDVPAIPDLVAHRGYEGRFPENTITALEAAIDAGAQYVECDVQCSVEGEPVLVHDADLRRTCAVDAAVDSMTLEQLRATDAHAPDRFGDTYHGVRIPALADLVPLLKAYPEVTCFVELKAAALDRFGVERVVGRVLDVLGPVRERCVPISFVAAAVEAARAAGMPRVGWVLDAWSAGNEAAARRMRPEYLFCNVDLLPPPPAPLWSGPWRWVAYVEDDPDRVLALAARGVAIVETSEIGGLVARFGADR